MNSCASPRVLCHGFGWQIGHFSATSNTPGTPNACDGIGLAELEFTPINKVQGPGVVSPLVGETVKNIGIATSPDASLNGFFLQRLPGDVDNDELTSEGIFVFSPSATVARGDVATVVGDVMEYFDWTKLGNALPSPVVVDLLAADMDVFKPDSDRPLAFDMSPSRANSQSLSKSSSIDSTRSSSYLLMR